MAGTQIQNMVSYIHTRRPNWQFIGEDTLLRIICQQFVIDWKIIDQVRETFKVEVRDVISHSTTGLVITLSIPGGE